MTDKQMTDKQKIRELRKSLRRALSAMNKVDTPGGCGYLRWTNSKGYAKYTLERTKADA